MYWDGQTWHTATARAVTAPGHPRPVRRSGAGGAALAVIAVVMCVGGLGALAHGSLRHQAPQAGSFPPAGFTQPTPAVSPVAAPPPAPTVAPAPAPAVDPGDLRPGRAKAPHPTSVTDADWAWPGMQYDYFEAGGWSHCSVGFPAWDSAGNRYFISAGHCFRDESGTHYVQPGGAGVEVYTPSDHRTPVGFEQTYTIPGTDIYTDVSLVEMYPGKKLYGNGWQHIPDTPMEAAVGDQACLVGVNHQTPNCGTVTATGVRETMTGYRWPEVVDSATFCAYPGDSGGAVYNDSGALGIEGSANTEQNKPGTPGPCSSQFIPIGTILQVLRQQIPSLTI
jgi:hypothetical protein